MLIKILIVDDREVVRKELRHVLELTGTLSVVGEAADGWDALRKTETLIPDIVLMDLEMPGMDGFEATRRMKAFHLPPVVVVFTVYGDAINQQKAFEAGADAFLVKGTDLQTILKVFKQFCS